MSDAPRMTWAGFDGPLDDLLDMVRAHRIDIAAVPLADLLEQLTQALHQTAPLERKGAWVVTTAWLVQLRSRLLLPVVEQQQAAAAEAASLRDRLTALDAARDLADWLDQCPQIGRDAFARGAPEFVGDVERGRPVIDQVEFLWSIMDQFGERAPDTAESYQSPRFNLHTVADAMARILARLDAGDADLRQMLPEPANDPVRTRSGVAVTFLAGLEMVRTGDVVMDQSAPFGAISVRRA